VPWPEVFAVFIVSHLVGDFLLQTEWQARNKAGGLGADPLSRRALVSHVATYGLAFVPALVWLASDLSGAAVAGVAAAVVVPHLVQDDGRLVIGFIHTVKRTRDPEQFVTVAVDQSLPVLALFALSLAVAA
jgi:hypothetical protein